VPDAKFRPWRSQVLAGLVIAFLATIAIRHWEVSKLIWYWPIVPLWAVAFVSLAAQWLLSLRDKPRVTTPAENARLAGLRVVVNVPVYNEDPALLDRCIWSLVTQSRPPQRISVVDDGSSVDYGTLERHWTRNWPGGCEVTWARQPNAGKKWAQARTFADDARADIFVTVDSDTCIDLHGIEEGLKPFADPAVASVAGFELVCNQAANWLTYSVSSRNIQYQLVTWGAQSALGDTLTNRGPFALYRAEIIREIIPAYIGETFLGHMIKLGDDAALTLFSRARGRAVQQVTAFGFAMHPEDFSHHFRQWTRWQRGSIIRDCWRLRYLPMGSYGWLFTVYKTFGFLMGPAVPALVAWDWPHSERAAIWIVAGLVSWPLLNGWRILTVRRSDESRRFRWGFPFGYALGILWCFFVLRWIRFFALATFLRQGWVTRAGGVEVGIGGDREEHEVREGPDRVEVMA
jgi:hyaluronan synthase